MDREAHRKSPGTTFLVTIFVIATFWSATGLAATSPDGLWQDISRDSIATKGRRNTVPDRYRTVSVLLADLDTKLRSAPPEKSRSRGITISLPMPGGSFQDFRVEYSPIMAPELAGKFPDIRTYLAVATGDAATTARLDLTPAGFHAIIFDQQDTIYIDPYQAQSTAEYISYYKHDMAAGREPFICHFSGQKVSPGHSILNHIERSPDDPGSVVGTTLHTYRLAVAATGEYTAFHGGTVPLGQAAIITAMNRVNAIYEREIAVRMVLVANNLSLVYTNAATDPYSNNNPIALLGENQANIDAVIGSGNYDVGHVFSTGGGGVAGFGVVCNDGAKARGETGLPTPIGDPFYVDFVAHEIGHQFRANHTFNGTTFNCGGGNRNPGTAYEPGSGSTIMAYAGICDTEDLQFSSDDNFHTVSFDEMVSFIATGGNCAAPTFTANTVPIINAGAAFNVPIATPLLLRADSAVDPDVGQQHTYSWEQFDLGAEAPPNTDDGSRPIFRSFKPKNTTIRYLPQMPDILNNTSTLGESLPVTTRSLTFRLTARDNATGGGGVAYGTVVHQVTDTAGPFRVTTQNTPETWLPGSSQTISWDVANTTSAPVNCADVTIVYSDSGFPNFSGTTLLLSTPNDGTETITVPLTTTTTGRVMVKCATNIFFDLNDAPITLASMCGNSVLNEGEQCDDGDAISGNGCSDFCQVETGWACTLPQLPALPSNCEMEGRIIVDKVTLPPGQPDLFTFDTSFSANFDLAESTVPFDSGLLTSSLLAGTTYRVSEIPLPGWDLTDITCTGNTDEGPSAINIDSGETVTCVFTNTKRGAIIVDKVTDPPGSDQIFGFTGSWGENFNLSDSSAPFNSVLLLPIPAGGPYSVAEDIHPDWLLTDVSCIGNSVKVPAGIVLDPGEVVTCTFTNAIKRARIIVDKVTEPSEEIEQFSFTLTGNNVNQQFVLADLQTPYDSGELLPSSENGTYNIAEDVPEGWLLDLASCDDGSPITAVDLTPGETVTCTFFNFKNFILKDGFENGEVDP